jgi:peptidoglycan-associated lipoprotein
MRKILVSLIGAALLAACGSTPEAEKEPAKVEDRTGGPAKPQTTPPAVQAVPPSTLGGGNPLKDPTNILSKRSVYFDFDSDAIKVEFVPMVEAHAKYLHEHRTAKMLIQGNADERGSREYNLALGQRRADALKKRLVLLGAVEVQIESVSLGKEKPVCSDHTEDCWYKNRRDDMLYSGEY